MGDLVLAGGRVLDTPRRARPRLGVGGERPDRRRRRRASDPRCDCRPGRQLAGAGVCRPPTATAAEAGVHRATIPGLLRPRERTAGTAPRPCSPAWCPARWTDPARQIEALRDMVAGGEVAGIHLEGPFISTARCGAHDPGRYGRRISTRCAKLLKAGEDTIRMVTIAPELHGGDQGRPAAGRIGRHRRHRAHRRRRGAAAARPSTRALRWRRTCSTACGRCTTANRARSAHCSTTSASPSSSSATWCTCTRPSCGWPRSTRAPRRTVLITDAMSATDAADGRYDARRPGGRPSTTACRPWPAARWPAAP